MGRHYKLWHDLSGCLVAFHTDLFVWAAFGCLTGTGRINSSPSITLSSAPALPWVGPARRIGFPQHEVFHFPINGISGASPAPWVWGSRAGPLHPPRAQRQALVPIPRSCRWHSFQGHEVFWEGQVLLLQQQPGGS